MRKVAGPALSALASLLALSSSPDGATRSRARARQRLSELPALRPLLADHAIAMCAVMLLVIARSSRDEPAGSAVGVQPLLMRRRRATAASAIPHATSVHDGDLGLRPIAHPPASSASATGATQVFVAVSQTRPAAQSSLSAQAFAHSPVLTLHRYAPQAVSPSGPVETVPSALHFAPPAGTQVVPPQR